MRIAIFTDTFLPKIDGVVSSIINLAKGLADKGHKVLIVAPRIGKTNFKYKNIEVKYKRGIPALFYEDFKFTFPIDLGIFKYLIKKKIQVIHFETQLTNGLEAIIMAKLMKVPLVGTFHTFIAEPEYLKHLKLDNKIARSIAWKYCNMYYNQCNLVTCPSVSTMKELKKNKCTKPIKVISNGIDFSTFDNSKSKEVCKKYKAEHLLLFVGRIAYEKNIFHLLECFKLVADKLPKTKLLLVGSGPQFEEVKKKIKKLNLVGKAILTGRIDHSKLITSGIFGACDMFITAATTENQPMTVLEAQANGLVTVGVDAKGLPDLILNDVNGYVVNPKDKKAFANAIIKILSNKKLYEKLKKGTLIEIAKHKLTKVIDVWEKTYDKLIKNRKK